MDSPNAAFDRETVVRRAGRDGDAERPARWEAAVSDAWNIGGNPNGGYLMALTIAALSQLSDARDPLTSTTHFHRPGLPGQPALISGEVAKLGRTMTTVRGGLDQEGKGRLDMMVGFGSLRADDDPIGHGAVSPHALPPPEQCVDRSELAQGVDLPLLDRLDIRIRPDLATTAESTGGAAAEMAGWIRFADGRAPDTRALMTFADAFPPTIFTLLGQVGWVPTLEMTIHVRRPPVSGWIAGHFVCDDLRNGSLIETGTLWDESGAVVARSRQLGLLLT